MAERSEGVVSRRFLDTVVDVRDASDYIPGVVWRVLNRR